MNLTKLAILGIGLGVFGFVGTAAATSFVDEGTDVSYNLGIDFRDSQWTVSGSIHSITVGGITVTANSSKNDVRNLYQDVNDGFGITTNEPDEIDCTEYLSVDFNSPTYLTGFAITDFFDWTDDNSNEDFGKPEYGFYSFDNGVNKTKFLSAGSGVYGGLNFNGQHWFNFAGGGLDVTTISFYTFDTGSEGLEDNDFSLAGFTTTPVPEPATMLLFGTGLVGLAGFARKRRNN